MGCEVWRQVLWVEGSAEECRFHCFVGPLDKSYSVVAQGLLVEER